MREMPGGAGDSRDRTPLAVRGSSSRTFRSLGLFAEASLLFWGGYLLAEALVQPLTAGTLSVLAGGLFLALATVLLFYLTWPSWVKAFTDEERCSPIRRERFVTLQGEPVEKPPDPRWILEKEEELPGPM